MLGEAAELVVRVGGGTAGEGRLEQPLDDQVRVAAVGRRGVRVVPDSEAEVPRRRAARRVRAPSLDPKLR